MKRPPGRFFVFGWSSIPGLDRRRTLIFAVVAGLIGVVAFVPAITGGWIYDDRPLIADNPYVHSWHEWPRWFVTDFWNVGEEVVRYGSRILYWRPAVSASYALDWQLGGGAPLVFHITNLVLQAATSVLAFLALRRWSGTLLPAFAAAALFVIHPTKAESVAWIAGRTDIVCLLAVLVATTGIARRLSGRHGGILLEVLGTVLAYLSKEQAIVLPCFAAVEAWVALGRPALDRSVLISATMTALPQAVIAIAYLVIRTLVMPIAASEGGGHVPLGEHALAVLETFGRYITLAFVPHDLSIQEGLVHAVHKHILHSAPYIAIGAGSTLALVSLAWWARQRKPILAVGVLVYFVTVLPTSNVVYTGIRTLISERFLYLPLIGLALVLASILAELEARFGRRVYIAAAVAVLALGLVSARRSANYRDEDGFWARELALHPDSTEARNATFAHYTAEHRFYAALAILQRAQDYDVEVKEHLLLARQVGNTVSHLTPDHDVKNLTAIDRFFADLVAEKPAKLDVPGVELGLDLSRLNDDREMAKSRPDFLAIRSDLQSRLGHDDQAVELAAAALEGCPTCGSLVANYAIVLACAGHYSDALTVLDATHPSDVVTAARSTIEQAQQLFDQAQQLQGPAALQAHASELAKLELWGRAFDLLAPYEAEITNAPKFATGFAELAFRAGEPAIARRVLAASKPPAEIDMLIADWAAKMGWKR